MDTNPEPTAWLVQVLETEDLSEHLPAAISWIHDTGCRASDLCEETVDLLSLSLQLKSIPSSRLHKVIQEAIQEGTLLDEGPSTPLQEAKVEQQVSDSDSSLPTPSHRTPVSEPPSSAPLAPGQTSHDQILCMAHGKWRGPKNVMEDDYGQPVCLDKGMCNDRGTDWRPHQTGVLPIPRKKKGGTLPPSLAPGPRTPSLRTLPASAATLSRARTCPGPQTGPSLLRHSCLTGGKMRGSPSQISNARSRTTSSKTLEDPAALCSASQSAKVPTGATLSGSWRPTPAGREVPPRHRSPPCPAWLLSIHIKT